MSARATPLSRRTVMRGLVGLSLAVAASSLGAGCRGRRSPATPGEQVHRVGWLDTGRALVPGVLAYQFRDDMAQLGWVEGRTLSVEWRFMVGEPERLPDLAAELVRLGVDLIVAVGSEAQRAAVQATTTIPVVLAAGVGDPVGEGFAESVARPGKNVTGWASGRLDAWMAKRLEVFVQAVPTVTRLGVLDDATRGGIFSPTTVGAVRNAFESAKRDLGVETYPMVVSSPDGFERAFAAASDAGVNGVMVNDSQMFIEHRARIFTLALQHQLPTAGGRLAYVPAGCLIYFAADVLPLWKRTAFYVDRILKGDSPATLPIELAATSALHVNLKTARTLGLTIPPAVIARATEVIQ